MNPNSRTQKSIINSSISLLFVAIQFILGFYSRKIFLKYLGTEILGLNTTAVNILQFLNLTELGIGAAVCFSLYKPLHVNDRTQICEIITLQKHLYRRIATGILFFAIIVMCFFPLIFKKIDLPLWYAYASFSVLLLGALLGYYVNFRQIILSAAQLDYKNQLYTRPWLIIKVILQIVALSHFKNPYVWWLILEAAFSIISAFSLHYVTMKLFPYLKDSISNYAELRSKYTSIFTKIKQLFFHKIAGFALYQASPLIIYGYTSLTTVALYGNYLIITNGIKTICNALFSSISGGIGDLVAEGDDTKIQKVFNELFSIRFFMAATIAFSIILLSKSFIKVWIGEQYVFPQITVLIITTILFIDIERNTVDIFISAYGLFKDIWAPVTEAAINLTLSIVLGYYFGIDGILSGTLISLMIIVMIWKPIFLYKNGFNTPILNYCKLFTLHLVPFILIGGCLYSLLDYVLTDNITGWFSLVVYSICSIIIFVLLYGVSLYFIAPGFRDFTFRLYNQIKRAA